MDATSLIDTILDRSVVLGYEKAKLSALAARPVEVYCARHDR